MQLTELFLIDLAAIVVLVFGLYVPRHHRRDMVVALLVLNLGVVAVTQALASASVSAGLGLGLFGVLSILRLRSTEVNQSDVAYYFASITLGLLGGFSVSPAWLSPALVAVIIAGVFVGDHPRFLPQHRHTVLTLDRAFTDEHAMRNHLAELLGADIKTATITKVDLVRDTTVVDVNYRLHAPAPAGDVSQQDANNFNHELAALGSKR